MFTPKSEKEIQQEMVWPAGVYDFEVVSCEMKTSKNGNQMLQIECEVFHPQGGTQKIMDWLVASDQPMCLMKLRHYCKSLDAIDAYESGTLENFPGVGACGKCKLKEEDDKDYGPRNRIADYVTEAQEEEKAALGVPASQTKRANAAATDDIPF